MLYGTNASRESGDRDYDPSPVPGLAAITPSRAPGVTTGGGGYAPAGSGGGGAPGAGETAVARSSTATYRPIDRSTSMPGFTKRGQARLAFAKSGRSSRLSIGQLRLSPISPIPTAWGGLSGLSDIWGDIAGGFKRALTPPRIVRKAIRYAGAGTAAVFAPVLTGAQQRKIFGLSPGESARFMKTQQASRIAIGVIATAGIGKAAYGAYTAKAATAAKAAAWQGPLQVGAQGPMWQAPTIAQLTSTPLSAGGTGLTATGYAAPIAAPSGSGFLAATGKGLVRGTGEVLKAIGVNVGAQAILSSIGPKGGGEAPVGYETAAIPPQEYYGAPGVTLPAQSSGGEASGGAQESPILAGATPIIAIGLGLAGLAMLMGKTKFGGRK